MLYGRRMVPSRRFLAHLALFCDVAGRIGFRLLLLEPASHYVGVGRIGRDQLADCAARKNVPLAEAERWLAPNLADEG